MVVNKPAYIPLFSRDAPAERWFIHQRRAIMKKCCLVVALSTFGVGALAGNGEKAGHGSDKEHLVARPASLKWGPAPPSLPSGAQMAVVFGNPGKAGAPYVFRAKLPDGYKGPPHWHPSDENVTVLKGTLLIGTGDKFDAAALEEVPVGSFMRMPKTTRHFAAAKGETILQLHGIGPFEITYVNPADDPRKK